MSAPPAVFSLRALSRRRLLQMLSASTALGLLTACGGTAAVTATSASGAGPSSAVTSATTAAVPTTAAALTATSTGATITTVTSVSAAPSTSASPPPAATATAQAVKLTLMTAQSQGAVDRDQKVADMLRAKQPNIAVTFEMPKADRHVEFPVRLAAGDPPDMVYLNSGFWRQYARKDAFLQLDPYVKRDVNLDDYFPAVVTSAKYRDHYYAWGALGGGSAALYYNKDLFTRIGLAYPDDNWTWSTFLDAATKLTSYTGGQHDPTQVAIYGSDSVVDWRWDLVLVEDAGDLLRPGGTASTLDSPAALESLQWLGDATGRGVWPSVRYPNATKASFVNGHMAMQIEYSSYAQGNANQIKQTFGWDVAHLPKGKQARFMYGGWSPILAAKATHYPDACWAYMDVAGGPDGQRYYMLNNGWLPAVKSVLDDALWLKGIPIDKQVFYAGTLDWRPQPDDEIIDQTDYNKLLNPALHKVWKGEARAQQAINEVIGPLNQVLASNT